MNTSEKFTRMLKDNEERLKKFDNINIINKKINQLEKAGLIKRNVFSLPQMDTIGSMTNKNKPNKKGDMSNRNRFFSSE